MSIAVLDAERCRGGADGDTIEDVIDAIGVETTTLPNYPLEPMKILRRALSAVFLMGLTAAIIRARGSGGTPPQHGGWRPLELPEPE